MAVAFNNTNTSQVAGHVSSVTDSTNMSVTAGGTNLCAFAEICYDGSAGESITSVTYGGQAMTSAGAAAFNATSNSYVELWYLVSPPTGLNTLVISIAGTAPVDTYYNLASFKNVNQTTPVRAGTYQTGTGSTGTGSITITSNANDLTLTATNSGGASITSTNQTSDGINNGGGNASGSDHATTSASSVTHTWTYGAGTNFAIAGFSINGDSADGGGSTSLSEDGYMPSAAPALGATITVY